MSQIQVCCQENCAVASATKVTSKESRVVECMQPSCSKSFHALCIGWSNKKAPEFANDAKIFLCNECLNYVDTISMHIGIKLKNELSSMIEQLSNKISNLETHVESELTIVKARIETLEKSSSKNNTFVTEIPNIKEKIKNGSQELNDKIENTNLNIQTEISKIHDKISQLKTECTNLQRMPQSQSSNGNDQIPISTSTANRNNDTYKYQIRISGIAEPTHGLNSIDRHDYEMSQVNKVLEHINVPNVILIDIFRIGSYVQDKPRGRSLVVTLNSIWDKRKILANAHKLKTYNQSVFISAALNAEEQLVEKMLLKRRWQLIQDGVDRKQLKIKNLKLYNNKVEVGIET